MFKLEPMSALVERYNNAIIARNEILQSNPTGQDLEEIDKEIKDLTESIECMKNFIKDMRG